MPVPPIRSAERLPWIASHVSPSGGRLVATASRPPEIGGLVLGDEAIALLPLFFKAAMLPGIAEAMPTVPAQSLRATPA